MAKFKVERNKGYTVMSNPTQLNKDISSKEKQIADKIYPIPSTPFRSRKESDRIGSDLMQERQAYRDLILENIEYDDLIQRDAVDITQLDELVELILDTVCTKRNLIRIAGDDFPADTVRSRFLKLTGAHIEYVMQKFAENTGEIKNVRKYLLACLYNAPATIENYYDQKVKHDMKRFCK